MSIDVVSGLFTSEWLPADMKCGRLGRVMYADKSVPEKFTGDASVPLLQ